MSFRTFCNINHARITRITRDLFCHFNGTVISPGVIIAEDNAFSAMSSECIMFRSRTRGARKLCAFIQHYTIIDSPLSSHGYPMKLYKCKLMREGIIDCVHERYTVSRLPYRSYCHVQPFIVLISLTKSPASKTC